MEVLVMLFNTICRALSAETTTTTILDAQYWIEIRWMFYCIIELGNTFCVNSSRVQMNHNCWSRKISLGRELSWTEKENKRKHNTNRHSHRFSVCVCDTLCVHEKVIHAFCWTLSKDPSCNFPFILTSKAYIDKIRGSESGSGRGRERESKTELEKREENK